MATTYTSWDDVMKRWGLGGADQRNWGTRGWNGAGEALNFGGVSYDPTADTGRESRDMSATAGRLTSRGSAWGVFMYRLNNLRTRRENLRAAQTARGYDGLSAEQKALVDAGELNKDDNALARDAVAESERTDSLNMQAEALCDLGEVLAAAGRPDDAAAALEQALDRCLRKQNLALARRVRERLVELRAETQPV